MRFKQLVTNPYLRGFFLLFLLCMVLITALKIPHVAFETNILSMLPQESGDGVALKMAKNYTESQAKRVVFLLEGKSRDTLCAQAAKLKDAIVQSGLFEEQRMEYWYEYYFPKRAGLLSDKVQKKLENRGSKAFKKEVYKNLFNPVPNPYGSMIQKDPLHIFPTFMSALFTFHDEYEYDNGVVIIPRGDSTAVLLSTMLKGAVFEEQTQTDFNAFVADVHRHEICKGSSLTFTGYITYSDFYLQTAKKESSLIGTLSMVGVTLLILIFFRSITTLFKSIIPILTGLTVGFACVMLLYEKIHIISLTMGICLIGICVDYTFHYLVEYQSSSKAWNSLKGLFSIFPGVTLGVFTSIIGYAVFFLIPYEGLQQIAVFTIAGLITSYGTVLFLLPILFGKKRKESRQAPSSRPILQRYVTLLHRRVGLLCILATILIVMLLGLPKLRFNDSVALFKIDTPDLDQVEEKIKSYYPELSDMQRYVLSDSSEEALLQKLESVELVLASAVDSGQLTGYQVLSQYVPSLKKQKEKRALLDSLFEQDKKTLLPFLTELGIVSNGAGHLYGEDGAMVTLSEWLKDPVSLEHRGLWLGEKSGAFYSVVVLQGLKEKETVLTAITDFSPIDIDTQKGIKTVLESVRKKLFILIPCMYLLILLLLCLRYKPKKSLQITAVPLLVYFFTLALLSLLSFEISIMHLLALNLVLGIGIDYVLFFSETKSHIYRTTTAVILSAVTTLLSFGLLAFSRTPALSAIGTTVIIGIISSLLFAPIIIDKQKLQMVEDDNNVL